MGRSLRVLIIEDYEDDALLLVRELQRGGYEVEFERVETAEAMQSALAQKTWDLILTDYILPGFNALQALEVLKASGLDVPFILVSGTIGEDTAVAALKAGANDFLIKGNFARLVPAIERELQEAKTRREHKRAQEALKSSETRYRLAARAINAVIWEWDTKTTDRIWSENMQTVFGYTPEEIDAEAAWWDEHIHPEDRERVVADIYALRESTGTIWADEYRFLRRDGSTAYVADRGYVERDVDGKPLRMIGAMSDITERKRAEEQVRAQAARLKVVADASKAFATSVQDYQGMLDLVAREIAEALGGVSGVRLLSDDGDWLEMASIYDMDPESLEFARILSDQALARVDEPNSSQRILQSGQALLLPGVSEDQLRALVKPEHWPNLKNVASHSWLLAPMGARGQDIGMLVISRKPGLPAFDEQDLSLAQDLADRAALTISNARLFKQVQNELIERKQAEEALRNKNEEIKIMSQQLWQTAKLATMGELAASIAHELNNPLATVSLRTEMLLAQFSPNAPQSRSLQIIDSEIKRMSALVANLLQFSRGSSSQISTVDVREELANTLELIYYHLRTHNILTVQELSHETPLVQVDRQQLRQVFLNLFSNAADAMPQGGTLTIRTWPGEKQDLDTLRLTATPSVGLPASNLQQMFIEVSDTGEGISPERLERVWEPFFTTKPEGKGTGLGLAICRRIIHEHGGTIEIMSAGVPGKGTTVQITLPAV
jgi:PAS domain S-box-containing protein